MSSELLEQCEASCKGKRSHTSSFFTEADSRLIAWECSCRALAPAASASAAARARCLASAAALDRAEDSALLAASRSASSFCSCCESLSTWKQGGR